VSIIFEARFGLGGAEGTTYSSLIITGLPSIVRANRKLDDLAILKFHRMKILSELDLAIHVPLGSKRERPN
jgi:hypothetical protein